MGGELHFLLPHSASLTHQSPFLILSKCLWTMVAPGFSFQRARMPSSVLTVRTGWCLPEARGAPGGEAPTSRCKGAGPGGGRRAGTAAHNPVLPKSRQRSELHSGHPTRHVCHHRRRWWERPRPWRHQAATLNSGRAAGHGSLTPRPRKRPFSMVTVVAGSWRRRAAAGAGSTHGHSIAPGALRGTRVAGKCEHRHLSREVSR